MRRWVCLGVLVLGIVGMNCAPALAWNKAGHMVSGAIALAPLLPEDYARTVQPIAERRVTLAGYRLADVLKKALAE